MNSNSEENHELKIPMSEGEARMEEVEDKTSQPLPDLQALKASARDIVEKAGLNGEAKDRDPKNGDSDSSIVNGTSEHEEPKINESETNGDSNSVDGENGDGGEEEAEACKAEDSAQSNEIQTEDTQETHSVNGRAVTPDGEDDEDSGSNQNGVAAEDAADQNGGDSEENSEHHKNDSEEGNEGDESAQEERAKTDGPVRDKGSKTPKKKKRVEEVSLEDSPPLRRSSRKKTPTKYAELEKDIDFVEEDVEDMDVEEIRDDDSDIQEVEPEDPLCGTSISITKSTKSSFGKKPNVVTIDDLKTLQLLATSAKKSVDSQKKENLTIMDTQAILAGKMGSGVSITPAKPKLSGGLTITSAGLTLGSGVTIKPNTPKLPSSSVTITSTSSYSNNSSPAPPPKSEETYDPNLTDDTFVVEAPSFIVPYVYEKPAKEGIKAFKESIEKIQKDLEKKEKEVIEKEKKIKEEERTKRREQRQKRRDAGEKEVEDDTEDEEEKQVETTVKQDNKDKDKEDIKEEQIKVETIKVETDKEPDKKEEQASETEKEEKKPEPPKPSKDSYFDSTLGKFFKELGMNLVQEYVQKDLLHQQKRRAHKDKSAAVMHAIMSLQKNLDDSRESNDLFHHEIRKCKFCSFRTESRIVMQHHMETPHMKNFIYRCNFCEYETKIPQEVLFHMDSVHGVKGKLERAPYFHQCPQCPFEDNGKGKLTRHKLGCDKRFKSELNQTPERDWDPPAKIKPQPVRPGYTPGYNFIPGQGRGGGMPPIRPGQSLLPGRNFVPNPRMPMMNAVNRGALANRGRPVGSYKGTDLRIPQPQPQQQNKLRGLSPQMLASQQMLAALNSQGLSVYGAGKGSPVPKVGSPSISITPLPGRTTPGAKKGTPSPAMKPGQPGSGQGKGNFVICEICDGYIKDLEQLRNHMQWIHKVKIHPKMIYNRPPLNCQKCQFRFFTDQGLERHLLGSHGLVTASMQDAANKGQDSGRCPVCGKVYQWKLLNHVAKDHNKTLKPAHLSYKCTVCTATFGQYKLFENHVYTAHSGVAKKADKAKQAAAAVKPGTAVKPGAPVGNQASVLKKPGDSKDVNEVIDLDDEEEIDDVEKEDKKAEVIDLETPKKRGLDEGETSGNKKAKNSEEEGKD